jgi:hypothetical protein
VERYYWREITKTYYELCLAWLSNNNHSITSSLDFEGRFKDQARVFKKQARDTWRRRHKEAPKYTTKEETEREFLSRVSVAEERVECEYAPEQRGNAKIGKWRNSAGGLSGAEEVAEEHYRSLGYSTLRCERRFISTWVAVFLTRELQDTGDPQVRQVMRSSTKGWSPNNRNTPRIIFNWPTDFGSGAYYARRKSLLEAQIKSIGASSDLREEFDSLLPESESARDYLWVNSDQIADDVRLALSVLPAPIIAGCIEWAIQDFWHRQPGWPDLFVYNNHEFFFAEVKSPYDELRQKQMNWFGWAVREAKIPCRICRIVARG